MKFAKTLVLSFVTAALVSLSACGGDKDKSAAADTASNNSNGAAASKVIKWGVCPGPYAQMVEEIIAPMLKEQGYSVELITFTDFVQPNLALDSGDIRANLYQHTAYLDNIVSTQNLKIRAATSVPTLGMGIFSQKVSKVEELEGKNAVFGIPNDPINLARSLHVAVDSGLITLKKVETFNKASLADIDQNPYNLKFVPMDAAQISRSLDSLDLGMVTGNYAFYAGLDYSKALGIENVSENMKLVITVRNDDDELYELIRTTIRSEEFIKAINSDHRFDGFTRPQWWLEYESLIKAEQSGSQPATQDKDQEAEQEPNKDAA